MAGLSSFKELQKETKRLDQKTQVTVFWDIENVRPVKNTSVLNFVSEVRSRGRGGGRLHCGLRCEEGAKGPCGQTDRGAVPGAACQRGQEEHLG